ncbi:MAG: hypothetical protein BGN96_08500 [Bacteroidales bacterium 45-6]|nr:MAG: hypothetical protein BGN96_08500 [Bacteroidales bacterium 45-6]
MRKYISILSIPLFLLATGCTNEDELTPSNADKNYFAPADNATDQESLLRKEFYASEKCYILFNDTLRHEALGTDVNGDTQYFTETIDLSYVMTGYAQYKYKYSYLPTIDQKKEAISFMKAYVLSHLSSKLRPFSWLLVSNISRFTISDASLYYDSDVPFVTGKRTTAIATQNIADMDEGQRQDLATSILKEVLVLKLTAQPEDVLKPFSKYSASYYGNYMATYPDDETANMQMLNEAGYIEPHYLWDIYPLQGVYPTLQEDIKAYVNLVLAQSPETVNEQYSGYPLVIAKFNAMRTLVADLGYTF